MRLNLFLLVILLAVLFVCPIVSAQAPQEEVSLTTYYPAPYGNYDVVTTNLLGVGTASPSPTTAVDIAPVGVATADNDVLTAVHIRPTFDDAGFSGVQHSGLLVETGNVGIGTNTPSQRLDVNGGIQLGNVVDGDGEAGAIRWTGTEFQSHNGTNWTALGTGTGGGGNSLDAADGSPKDVVWVDADGNVGIGTKNPSPYKLKVMGSTCIWGGNLALGVYASSSEPFIIFGETTTKPPKLNDASSICRYNPPTGPTHTLFISGQTEVMALLDDGRVGIGTVSPSSKLEVKDGDIRVTNGSFIDDGTTLTVPDYVFEPGYSLKPLSEVEEFVLKHKHLEGLPAAGDIQGWAKLSLQDRDMKLLEKIEELTLYIIALEKKIAKLER